MTNYAVSSGNGNDGVSQLYPNYCVETDEPWLLAQLAAVSEFKNKHYRRWCRENLEVDGEAEYTITAMLLDPPGRDGHGYSEHNGAWRLWEIYTVQGRVSERSECPQYDSLDECFGKAMVVAARRKEAR